LEKESSFNKLSLPHPGIQKVTGLYPINFSSGSQAAKNIRELRVEKHFHSFSEFFCVSRYEILEAKEGTPEVKGYRL